MLHESLREDMKRKYGSDWDEESDLELVEENKKCKEYDFIGESKGGLNTHVTRKHFKEN